ncbi:hemicentin-2-like [Scylla paramamosain]|uniref:hemicentin-2-like n=1 Tax=Scylla paramamosain TaxID=85552 RepID=UPI003083B20E
MQVRGAKRHLKEAWQVTREPILCRSLREETQAIEASRPPHAVLCGGGRLGVEHRRGPRSPSLPPLKDPHDPPLGPLHTMVSGHVRLLLLLLAALVSGAAASQDGPSPASLQSRWVTSAPPPHSAVPPHSRVSTAALEQKQPTVVVTEVEESSVTNLTAQLGTSVFLPCQTEEPTERQVSWVRRRDWHILTSGTLTYTREGRFAVHHPEGSTEWTLAIKYVTLEDAGTYECQVSTGDGLASHLVVLEVVAPRAVIPGRGVHHVQAGSTISLTCLIEQSPEAPQYIFWYHDSRMINYDRRRGGVEVRVEAGPKVASRLKVSGARPEDSGNYTCAAANTEAASVFVYVTEDNKIAAVQPRALGRGASHHVTLPALAVMLLAIVLPAR